MLKKLRPLIRLRWQLDRDNSRATFTAFSQVETTATAPDREPETLLKVKWKWTYLYHRQMTIFSIQLLSNVTIKTTSYPHYNLNRSSSSSNNNNNSNNSNNSSRKWNVKIAITSIWMRPQVDPVARWTGIIAMNS